MKHLFKSFGLIISIFAVLLFSACADIRSMSGQLDDTVKDEVKNDSSGEICEKSTLDIDGITSIDRAVEWREMLAEQGGKADDADVIKLDAKINKLLLEAIAYPALADSAIVGARLYSNKNALHAYFALCGDFGTVDDLIPINSTGRIDEMNRAMFLTMTKDDLIIARDELNFAGKISGILNSFGKVDDALVNAAKLTRDAKIVQVQSFIDLMPLDDQKKPWVPAFFCEFCKGIGAFGECSDVSKEMIVTCEKALKGDLFTKVKEELAAREKEVAGLMDKRLLEAKDELGKIANEAKAAVEACAKIKCADQVALEAAAKKASENYEAYMKDPKLYLLANDKITIDLKAEAVAIKARINTIASPCVDPSI